MVNFGTHIHCSSSIGNFEDGLKRRYGVLHRDWFSKEPTIFFGLYHIGDYLRLLFHRGERKIFWCGSDIKNLSVFWSFIIKKLPATHFCENIIEQKELGKRKIFSTIHPMIFDDPNRFDICWKQSDRKQAYIHIPEKREIEYGLYMVVRLANENPMIDFHIYGIHGTPFINNLFFHGKVSSEQFEKETESMHIALRFNEFDGFSDLVAKAFLRGQYVMSKINYKFSVDDIKLIDDKDEPNSEARNYWLKELNKPL